MGKKLIIGVLAAALMATMSSALAHPQAVSPQRALLGRYCLTCHTQKAKERGAVPIALDSLDLNNVAADAESWEKVVRKMRAGLMPPPGAARPDQDATQNFASWLEAQLDRAAA